MWESDPTVRVPRIQRTQDRDGSSSREQKVTVAHPTKEQLAAYASGAQSEGMSLLIASHLTFCPQCRAVVEQYEALGAAVMMSAADVSEIEVPSLEACMAKLDVLGGQTEPVADHGSPMPMPLRSVLDHTPIDDLNWKFRMPGLHEFELDGFEGEHVSLLRVRPGTGMLHHTHEGEEATLILTGEMEDNGTVYRKGDVALADHNDDHKPRVIGDEICYCLIVMSGNMRFTGPVSRALNLFTRTS
ncbi:MAG: ChrR family anti-sigma-E factor [Pseudomonadota bacterium]